MRRMLEHNWEHCQRSQSAWIGTCKFIPIPDRDSKHAANLSEDTIIQKLHEAIESAPSSDGYADIDLTSDTRLKCAAVLIPLLQQDDEWHYSLRGARIRWIVIKDKSRFPEADATRAKQHPKKPHCAKRTKRSGSTRRACACWDGSRI